MSALRTSGFTALIFLCACEGPVGEQGPTGPPREANAIVHGFDLNESDFVNVDSKLLWEFVLPEITEEVVEHGSVHAYKHGNNGWRALPFVWSYWYTTDSSLEREIIQETYSYDVGEFVFEFGTTDGGGLRDELLEGPHHGQIKVVIVL